MKAYSRTGDKGETGLYEGTRVWKNDLRVEAYGSVDELNSQLGLARSLVKRGRTKDVLGRVQRDLFVLGSDLATRDSSAKIPRISQSDVSYLENTVDDIHERLVPLKRFILPGGVLIAAELHVARSVCRRAERRVVALSREESVNPEVVKYLNRLSSLLFDMARLANKTAGIKELEWVREKG